MSNLARPGSPGWGEDLFALSTSRSLGDAEAAAEAEESIRSRYRLELRQRFEQDPNVRESLESERPAAECREWVLDSVKDLVRGGTQELFEQVVDELLKELDHFRELPAALYLVDGRTGKALMPMEEGLVHRPPDFVGEDGEVRRAMQIVHPGVSAGLAMKASEDFRTAAAIRRAEKAGGTSTMATVHLRDPGSMVGVATEWLKDRGLNPGRAAEMVEASVEFGRESYDGVLQSPNYAFHRFKMYGELLGRKVLEVVGGPGSCEIDEPVLESNSRQRWYTAKFRYARRPEPPYRVPVT